MQVNMPEPSDERSVHEFLNSDNPLSEMAIEALLGHKEEDLYVDYKEFFDVEDEKHWLGMTTDVMAFANTRGGYLVFGVSDQTFDIVGLPRELVGPLTNTNMIMQKLNRYVLPPFSSLRSRKHRTLAGQDVVVMHIPESKGRTHVFVKDVSYAYPSGKTKQWIHAGAIFIRRSATNHVVEPDDIEFIINRRIEHYKESVLDKISRVIEAPPEHQVLVFDPRPKHGEGNTYVISDSPEAIPVKGMSFTVVPSSDIEELWGWISLSKRDPGFRPGRHRLWHLYAVRHSVRLASDQALELIRFLLLMEMPVFYWLRTLSAEQIKPLLSKVFGETSNRFVRHHILKVSAFLGSTFYGRLIRRLGNQREVFSASSKRFPRDCHQLFEVGLALGNDTEKLEAKLTAISEDLSKEPDVMKKTRAKAIDCHLYARSDRYTQRC